MDNSPSFNSPGVPPSHDPADPVRIPSVAMQKASKVHDNAQMNFRRDFDRDGRESDGLRLIANAVSTDTMLNKYIPAIKDFFAYCLERVLYLNTTPEVDQALSASMNWGAYYEDKTFSLCKDLLFGIKACFPEITDSLPMAYRAYKSWERAYVPGEGQGIPDEAIEIIASQLDFEGKPLMALVVRSTQDAYFRVGEWQQIRREDIIDDGDKVGVILGLAERGERVKTGHNQGVVFDSLRLREEWRSLRRSLCPKQLAFPFSADDFRASWHAAKVKTGLTFVGPPHDLRHSGAAKDIEQQFRTLEQVRRRGRWKLLPSVQRYTKTWLLIRARERMSKQQLDEGRRLLLLRGPRELTT